MQHAGARAVVLRELQATAKAAKLKVCVCACARVCVCVCLCVCTRTRLFPWLGGVCLGLGQLLLGAKQTRRH